MNTSTILVALWGSSFGLSTAFYHAG